MKKDSKVKQRRSSKAYYIDEDWDEGLSDGYLSCDEGDYQGGYDYEEYKPNRSPLRLDILSFQRPNEKKKKEPKTTASSGNPASKLNFDTESETLDPLEFLVHEKPRLVRSKSFTTALLTRRSLRRSSSLSSMPLGQTTQQVRHCAARCIQSLIPARSSVVGPAPRASLTVFSNKCRAAVLIIWPPLKVIPLVGCSPETAQRLQDEIYARVEPYQNNMGWLGYWRLSTTLYARRQEWTQLLEEFPNDSTTLPPPWKALSQGCLKADMTLGRSCNHYDMLKDYVEKQESSPFDIQVESCSTAHVDQVCLVCFDEISDVCQLLPCGHVTCMDCCKAYLKCAANSGQGSIQCAAHKCKVEINIFDAAHILDDDYDTLQSLVRFTLERSAPVQSRFCPSPDCGRLLKPSGDFGSQQSGFNILLCDCGTSLCNDCETGGPAHPGVSCTDFSRLRKAIDSGKMDAELAK
jgi:hypothetical protein